MYWYDWRYATDIYLCIDENKSPPPPQKKIIIKKNNNKNR